MSSRLANDILKRESQTSSGILDGIFWPGMAFSPLEMRALILKPLNGSFELERRIELDASLHSWILGRSKTATDAQGDNLLFHSRVVSRQHACLTLKQDHLYLQDTKSSSGTFINAFRLSPPGVQSTPFEILDGDIIQLGEDITMNDGKLSRAIDILVSYKSVSMTVCLEDDSPPPSKLLDSIASHNQQAIQIK